MTDWRLHAANSEWDKIDGWEFRKRSRKDVEELRAILKKVVPMVKRGDGVETFWDYATSDELNDSRWRAADLLRIVDQKFSDEMPLVGQVFFAEVGLAKEVLLGHGIELSDRGLRDTFIYWHHGGIVQLRSDIGSALRAKVRDIEWPMIETSEFNYDERHKVLVRWYNLYPWRRALSLFEQLRLDRFQPNSNLHHALLLLDWYEFFRVRFSESARGFFGYSWRGNKGARAESILTIAQASMEIGKHAEAILKKEIEPDALRRRAQKHAFAFRNEGRDLANAQRKTAADDWKKKAEQLARETHLEGMARARWVGIMLLKKHNISRTEKTIARALSVV